MSRAWKSDCSLLNLSKFAASFNRHGLVSNDWHSRMLLGNRSCFDQEANQEWIEVDLRGVRVEHSRPFGECLVGFDGFAYRDAYSRRIGPPWPAS